MAKGFISIKPKFVQLILKIKEMKSIIVTGASGSIGFECALQICKLKPNDQIILPCRNSNAGNEILNRLRKKTGHKHLIAIPLELDSFSSIKNFVEQYSTLPNNELFALINNAGLQNVQKTKYTKDGFEQTFGVNHLGPLLLTLELLPYMSENSRITFTASGTHDPKQSTGMPHPVFTSVEAMAHPTETSDNPLKVGQMRYTTSKLCNVLTAYELQKQIKHTGISVNAFDPGFVPGTGLGRNYPKLMRIFLNPLLKLTILLPINAHTASTSGKRLARVALGVIHSTARGEYFEGEKEIKSSDQSYDTILQKKLWDSSMTFLGKETLGHQKSI